ncbi:MAG: dUTP diphosphatase [Spirochaetales bacterium]|nr:dUTP diphosphatase [Spirochaetales bacterium]
MDKVIVRITASKGARVPCFASSQAAGADLSAYLPEGSMTINSGKWAVVPTGLKISLPIGFEAQIRPRSGLAAKHGITVLNSPGTIDSDYRGDVKIILINLSQVDFTISDGDRIAQMVIARHEICEFELVTSLDYTERGDKGFGSTGIKN